MIQLRPFDESCFGQLSVADRYFQLFTLGRYVYYDNPNRLYKYSLLHVLHSLTVYCNFWLNYTLTHSLGLYLLPSWGGIESKEYYRGQPLTSSGAISVFTHGEEENNVGNEQGEHSENDKIGYDHRTRIKV